MKNLLCLSLAGLLYLSSCTTPTEVTNVDMPDISQSNSHYVGNRAPLITTPFIKLPIGSIEPDGWVKKQLELMADGYFGHLGDISKFLIKENNSWLSEDGSGDHGWEELPYWLKGYSNIGYVLGRKEMIEETKIWIEAVLNSQKEDGWFGPDEDRTGAATNLKGRVDLWPNMIMLFILQDYYLWSEDDRVIALMTNYFNYLKDLPEDEFLVGYWPANRGGDLLYTVYWLYNRTGDEELLALADKVHKKSLNWTDGIPNWHNVNMSQSFGEPATYYMQTGDIKHLEAPERNYEEIRELYGHVPGGMFASDENCREGLYDPRQSVETCGMIEMMLSTEILFTITGDPVWADRCEDVAFNSYPASLTEDMKALRYMTSPNMVQSDKLPKNPGIQNGGPMFHMNPHRHRCCQHNQGHGWPYYSQHLWLATADNGLAAALYSASTVKAKVGKGVAVSIREETNYPFEEVVEFVVNPDKKVSFPLYLRIPGWCTESSVQVNGEDQKTDFVRGYIRIEKTWEPGDIVRLGLPMSIGVRAWEKNKNSVSVDYGPLSFSLKIDENYVREGGTDDWPAWEIYPASPWNYGLVKNDLLKSLEVVKKSYPNDDMPFTHDGAPIEMRVLGKLIPEWGVDETGLVQELPMSPVESDQVVEELTLIPMGAARLRISSFPLVK